MIAHQRIIREREGRIDLRSAPASLRGYTVDEITHDDALEIILQYEWLGTLGHCTIFMGLKAPDGELQGVACFGYGPPSPIRKQRIGEPALCLERGACVHYAPKNAASFLISRACKLIYKYTGVARFFAYCDPEAGEYGGIYQACGWVYLGQGLQNGNNRRLRAAVLRPGRDPDDPKQWQSTRVLRDHGLTYETAEAKGWTVLREREGRRSKYVYATHVGPDRAVWRQQFPNGYDYPSPQPELKRKPHLRPVLVPPAARQRRLEQQRKQQQSDTAPG